MFRLGGRGGLPLAVRFRLCCAESIQYSLHRCSTLTEGRNRLLEVALERYAANDAAGPLYYISLDGDVRLEEVKDFGKQCERRVRFEPRAHRRWMLRPAGRNTGNAWRTFEAYLEEWEPAVGYTSYMWQVVAVHAFTLSVSPVHANVAEHATGL